MAASRRRDSRRQHGEGSVYRQKNPGRWVASADLGWKDGRRDRRYFYGITPDEAIAARAQFLRERGEGFTRPKGRGDTLEDWLRHWLDDIATDLKDGSRPDYASKIRLYIVPAIGWMRLPKLAGDEGIEAIEAMYAGMRRQGLAESTILKTHAILSRALKVAVQRRKIGMNPCDFVAKPKPRPVKPQPPKASEAARILTAARELPNAARWETGLSLGLRQGEALGLLRPCIDLEKGTMRIDWSLQRLTWQHGCDDPRACGEMRHRYPCPEPCPKAARASGRRHVCTQDGGSARAADGTKGKPCPPGCTAHARSCPQRRGGGAVLVPPKSEESRETIPVPGYLLARIEQHLAARERTRQELGPDWRGWSHDCARRPKPREIVCPACRKPVDPGALIFGQPNGRPVRDRQDWGEWTALLEQLGIPHYRVHDGRHFAATLLHEQGVPVEQIQVILRHADIRTTQIYTHLSVDLTRAALERSAAALWGADAEREAALRTEAAGLDGEIAKLLGDGR